MLFLAALLLFLSLVLFWLAWQRRKASGLPAGRIIYTDTKRWEPVQEALYDASLGLTGRPDYLVQQDAQIIPVEVKSGQASAAPYDAHIFQLAAYCLLVESSYGQRPDYGILHYANRTFAVDYTQELENELLELIEEMRSLEGRREIARSHESAGRCRGCGYRSVCDQKLVSKP